VPKTSEKIFGFYKGVASPLVGVSFVNSVLFFSYGVTTRLLGGNDEKSGFKYFGAGCLTGAVTSLVEGPVDLFKAKMQVQYSKNNAAYRNTFDCAWKILRHYGLRNGVFQGFGATVLRNIPSNGAYFVVYESTKNKMTELGGGTPSAPGLLLSGGLAGVVYWLSCYPQDVIKSRMQTEPSDRTKRLYTSSWDCAKKLYAQGGLKPFTRGLAPCLIRSFPANAACFYGYELCRSYLSSISARC